MWWESVEHCIIETLFAGSMALRASTEDCCGHVQRTLGLLMQWLCHPSCKLPPEKLRLHYRTKEIQPNI